MSLERIIDLPAAAALTGTEPIETVQAGVSVKTTVQAIANMAPVSSRVYTALLSNNNGVITAIQLKNTIGDGSGNGTTDIAWTNPSNGLFASMSSGPFTANKTFAQGVVFIVGGVPFIAGASIVSTSVIDFVTRKFDGSYPVLPNFTNLPIEIRVFN